MLTHADRDGMSFDVEAPSPEAVAEQCYRRGFTQGAAAAIEAMRIDVPQAELDKWIDGLNDWRREEHGGKMNHPVWLARTSKWIGRLNRREP